jgi:hypothetical protein
MKPRFMTIDTANGNEVSVFDEQDQVGDEYLEGAVADELLLFRASIGTSGKIEIHQAKVEESVFEEEGGSTFTIKEWELVA